MGSWLRRKRFWTVLVALAATVAMSGCSWVDGREYYVTYGNGAYVNFREPTTALVINKLLPGCKFNPQCVADVLHGIKVPYWFQSDWRRATTYVGDLWKHAIEPSFYDHHRCPTLHIDFTNDLNWETHSCSW